MSHQGALLAGGPTVAVLGCGADVVYPRSHRKLYSAITDNGSVLSELPPGTPPTRWAFPLRNRVLAALGDAVLVVEAGLESGALQTADWALELGRPVFAVPGPITGDNYRGTNRLIYEGAFPALDPVVTVQDFLLLTRIERGDRHPTSQAASRFGLQGRPFPPAVCYEQGGRVGDKADVSPAETLVMERLLRGALSVDALAERTKLSVREVTAALARLHLKGVVTRAGPGLFIRAP
jgi:DNA processing protein